MTLSAPSELAEIGFSIVTVGLAALMFLWWRTQRKYERRDSDFSAASRGGSPVVSPVVSCSLVKLSGGHLKSVQTISAGVSPHADAPGNIAGPQTYKAASPQSRSEIVHATGEQILHLTEDNARELNQAPSQNRECAGGNAHSNLLRRRGSEPLSTSVSENTSLAQTKRRGSEADAVRFSRNGVTNSHVSGSGSTTGDRRGSRSPNGERRGSPNGERRGSVSSGSRYAAELVKRRTSLNGTMHPFFHAQQLH